jgi:hypothetical protein
MCLGRSKSSSFDYGVVSVKRIASFSVVVALLVAACGGSDPASEKEDSSETTVTIAPAATQADGDSATSTTSQPSADESGGESPPGSNVATVTIGDATWEFDANPEGPITDCDPDFFGAFWVVGGADDGSGLSLLLPPEGDSNFEDPPSVRVTDGASEADWTADVTLVDTANYSEILTEGDSQVDSWTIDGNSVSGTATFVDENQIFAVLGGTLDSVDPVAGSFEVSCG